MPRPAHTAALTIPGERTGVAPELGERGFLKVGLPEAANKITLFYFGSAVVERSIPFWTPVTSVSSNPPVSDSLYEILRKMLLRGSDGDDVLDLYFD